MQFTYKIHKNCLYLVISTLYYYFQDSDYVLFMATVAVCCENFAKIKGQRFLQLKDVALPCDGLKTEPENEEALLKAIVHLRWQIGY